MLLEVLLKLIILIQVLIILNIKKLKYKGEFNVKKNEIKIGVILSYIIVGLDIIIGLVYTPILIRMLGQSEYGLYSLIASIISYLALFDLGFGNAIIVYTARYKAKGEKEKEQKLHGMFLIIYTIIGIIAGIVGFVLFLNVNNMFGNTMSVEELETAKSLMLILMLNLVITFPFSVFSSIITAYEKFVFSKLLNIFRIVMVPVIMIPLLLSGHKSFSLVIVLTIVNICVLLTNAFFCLKKLKIKLKFGKIDFKLLKEIFSYSFYIFLNTIIDKANWSIDQFILGSTSGTFAVSVYAVAVQLNSMYLNFSTSMSSVLLPKITKMEANKASDKEFTDVFIKTGRLQFLVMGLIMSGFIIFGQQFINIWAGETYSSAFIIGCILMIPVTIPLIQNVGQSILQAKNKYKFRTLVFFGIAIVNVLISIPLAQNFGGIGAAIGTAVSLIIGQGIIINIYYHKKIHINIIQFWKNILKMAIPVLPVAIIGFVANYYLVSTSIAILVLKIAFYSMIYFIAVWVFAMNDYEKDIVRIPLKKFKGKILKKN